MAYISNKTMLEEIAFRQARLQFEQDRLFELQRAAEQLGEDDYEDGVCIRFTKQFSRDGKHYNYAVIKSHGKWYTTGPADGNRPQTWESLVAWWMTGIPATDIAIYTEMEWIKR